VKVQNENEASHEHANGERSCTSDLKHALFTTPTMLRMRMLPVLPPMATGVSPEGIQPRPNCL